MAFLVKRGNGSWEIRESRQTANGPRSFTLATLREETPGLLERVNERSKTGLMESELIQKLDEAGVPPTMTNADRAARDLLAELAAGGRLSEALRQALLSQLQPSEEQEGFYEGGLEVAVERQGRLLEDVLDLAAALPYEPSDDIAQVPLRSLLDPERQAR